MQMPRYQISIHDHAEGAITLPSPELWLTCLVSPILELQDGSQHRHPSTCTLQTSELLKLILNIYGLHF